MSSQKREPCSCGLWPFPHRHTRKCEDYKAEQRELDDDGEEWVDGTPKSVINWMRAEVGRG